MTQDMRRLTGLLALGVGLLGPPHLPGAVLPALPQQPDIEVFVQPGCPHCGRAKAFLTALGREQPGLVIVERDVATDPGARQQLIALAEAAGIEQFGVPAFSVGGVLLVGFDEAETTGREIRELLRSHGPGSAPASREGIAKRVPDIVDLPVLGPLSAGKLGLPLFTLAIGLLDGFNPCAMWALLLVLSLLVNLQSRTKMLVVGGTFVVVGGVLYYAFMAAWLELFLLMGFSRVIQWTLGGFAIVIGAINTKDFWAFRRGPSLTVPHAAEQPLYARMRRVLTAENLAGAIVGVAALSAMVNVVELLCTAGLPAVYTQILSAQGLSRWGYYGYLGLYTAAYILDDSLVLAVATVTFSRRKLQERAGRWLKLLSGTVMLALGLTLILKPEWLR